MYRAKDKNARVMRWFLSLQPFNYEVVHRAGKEMGNADGLSRMYTFFAAVARPRGSKLGGRICDKPRGRVINGKYVRAELLTGLCPLTGLRPEGGLQFTKWPPQKDYKPQQPEQCAKAWQPHPQQSWGVAGQYKKGQHRPGREEREE